MLGTDLKVLLSDGTVYTVPLNTVLASAVSAYLTQNPVNGGVSVTSASVNSSGILTLTLSDSSVVTASLAPYVNSALASLPAPLSSASLADTVLLLTTASGPVSVDLGSLKGDSITSVTLNDKALVINTNTPGVFSVDLSSLAPTLQQFQTDAAASLALSPGTMYYDALGVVKIVLPVASPLIALESANLRFSQNPALVNSWDSTAKILHFNSTGTASAGNLWGSWALSASLVSSLSFNWAGSWCMALKVTASGNNLRCMFAFDPVLSNWDTTSGLYDENQASPYVYVRSSGQIHTVEALGGPFVLIPNKNVDTYIASPDGCYVLWSYDASIPQAKIEFFTKFGVSVYASTLNGYVPQNLQSPIAFYTDLDGFDFHKGLFYSPSYQPFSVWGQYFA
jgi:hypothetical protein